MTNLTILGIETSCDETSLCLLNGSSDAPDSPVILSHKTFSSETILAQWGGVVPEIAARNHSAKITPLLKEVLESSNVTPGNIDMIGVTTHPGLLGPLLTGLNTAKTLSLMHEIPIFPVNHLYAHLEAVHLSHSLNYPYLGLIISGGHSIYMLVRDSRDFTILGSTIDDAAGEAFDKGAKLLGLGYPGGKIIDQLSTKGDPNKVNFPIGLANSKDSNLSFSGLKTSLRHFVELNPQYKSVYHEEGQTQELADICASYQSAIIKALSLKLSYALKEAQNITGQILPIVVGGGVACNRSLREILTSKFLDVYFVEPEYCTDNGAMIANLALRNQMHAIPFPECLGLDAKGRFIKKGPRASKS